jgi:hypothetical protein
MYNNKKLILTIIFSLIFLAASEIKYRGHSRNELMGSRVPLSFTNMISQNYNILPSQLNAQRGTFMIIVPDALEAYLSSYVEFKYSQGFDVSVLTLTEAGGSASSVKNTISAHLQADPMLEYILLIGDVDGFAAFPSFYYGPENDVTDQQFTHLLGEDTTPDVFIGRLSIDSISDLIVIISKTIRYARDPLAFDGGWLDRGLIVAGNYANTYPIPITPKWTSYWLRDELLDYGYSDVDTVFYPPTQQGAPFIIPIIDNGVGIVNYRGWGDANGWHYPEFHVDDVNDLNNGWLTPVFMSYVCNSNDFANNVDPCLAEAILRGGTPTVPKGGVAFVGPSDLHTSTKYNNVINAYMYDAMLNHGVVELGPAMQAGQSGLNKEFPAQNGAGEAQEFYANVYNILGDPSLQVYIDTPDQFSISSNTISRADNYISIDVENSNGDPVNNAVISIMSGGQLLSKGITDVNGEFAVSTNLSSISSVDIYANKPAFIQGHINATVEENDTESNLAIAEIIVHAGGQTVTPVLGAEFSLDIVLENLSSSEILSQADALITFSDAISPSSLDVTIPAMGPGETVTLTDMHLTASGFDAGNAIVGKFEGVGSIEVVRNFAVEIHRPSFSIAFDNQALPSNQFQAEMIFTNYSPGHYEEISFNILPISDGAQVMVNNSTEHQFDLHPFQSVAISSQFDIELGDVAPGSDITFLINMKKNDDTFHTQEVVLHVPPTEIFYPVAPDNYGYWAYDNTDTGFEQRPDFNWIELDPNHGGEGASHYQLDDDDHVRVDLPFGFKYYGNDYDQITISSNGWTSFEMCEIDYFWNMSIPMYMGPKAMLAPFSDDLETIDSNDDGNIDTWVNVYTRYDQPEGRFIIEWSRALNGYDEVTEETFQVILYDEAEISTQSGDGIIEFQYLDINDVDVTKNYSTVGIESPDKSDGLQYVFNNVYSDGAATLENGRAIRFTTEAPSNYVGTLDLAAENVPNDFSLSAPYPNPFNPVAKIDLKVADATDLDVTIFDLMGREVRKLHLGFIVPGQYQFSWKGKNEAGNYVSSGTYFLVANTKSSVQTQKLVFLK